MVKVPAVSGAVRVGHGAIVGAPGVIRKTVVRDALVNAPEAAWVKVNCPLPTPSSVRVNPFTDAIAELSKLTLQAPGELDVGGVSVSVFWSSETVMIGSEPSCVVVAHAAGVCVAPNAQRDMEMATLDNIFLTPPLSRVTPRKVGTPRAKTLYRYSVLVKDCVPTHGALLSVQPL